MPMRPIVCFSLAFGALTRKNQAILHSIVKWPEFNRENGSLEWLPLIEKVIATYAVDDGSVNAKSLACLLIFEAMKIGNLLDRVDDARVAKDLMESLGDGQVSSWARVYVR